MENQIRQRKYHRESVERKEEQESNNISEQIHRQKSLFLYEGQSQCDPVETMSHSILGLDLSDEHFPAMLKEISFEELLFKGQMMRKELADILPVMICNVCSRYRSSKEMGSHEETTFFLRDIESQLQILRADGPSTSRAPRHGHTTVFFRGVKYCLQPTGISGSGENMKMSICLSCWSLLQQQELPFASLVHIDAGMRPTHLPEMTLLESLIVSPLRPHRFFALAKPKRFVAYIQTFCTAA
jgi:hypothetical protein